MLADAAAQNDHASFFGIHAEIVDSADVLHEVDNQRRLGLVGVAPEHVA
jgi:hypothetical protein